MAKNMQPYLKRCRTLGISPSVMGVNKESNRNPGPQRKSKKSEYALQLNEKQKVKFIYGVLEKQFHSYYEKAARMKGNTGDELMTLLERRLDNVVFRLGLANTRREARQLVNHGHFTINGKRVNIPSYLVKVGETVAVCEKSRSNAKFKKVVEDDKFVAAPKWIEKSKNAPLEGKIVAMPGREDLDFEVAVNLIVELYSK
ncbi:MAG: 30S ribosomal protein S4 [Oscillospiraceae bacterium]|nr:30S ribosomal protein S4 [Oscillospiraceae bacterium]